MDSSENFVRLGIQKGGKTGKPFLALCKSAGLEFRGAYFHEVFPNRRAAANDSTATFEDDMLVETTGRFGFGLQLRLLKNGNLVDDLPKLDGIIVGEDILTERALPQICGLPGQTDITVGAWLGIGDCKLCALYPEDSIDDQFKEPSSENLRRLFAENAHYYTKYPKIVRTVLAKLQGGFGWQERIIYRDGGLETMVQEPGDLAIDIVATGDSARKAKLNFDYTIGDSTTVLAVHTPRMATCPELADRLRTLRESLLGDRAKQGPQANSLLKLWRPLDQIPRLG
jgi:hypothetical protein